MHEAKKQDDLQKKADEKAKTAANATKEKKGNGRRRGVVLGRKGGQGDPRRGHAHPRRRPQAPRRKGEETTGKRKGITGTGPKEAQDGMVVQPERRGSRTTKITRRKPPKVGRRGRGQARALPVQGPGARRFFGQPPPRRRVPGSFSCRGMRQITPANSCPKSSGRCTGQLQSRGRRKYKGEKSCPPWRRRTSCGSCGHLFRR